MRRVLATLCAAALLLAGCGSTSTASGPLIPAGKRKAAPETSGPLIQGGTFDLAQHRGSVVLINFWASNCAPCRTEAPELADTYDDLKSQGVVFVGIDIRDEKDNALAYLADTKPPYDSLFDPAGRQSLAFPVPPSTIPFTLVLDKQGRVAFVQRANVWKVQLEPVLRDLIAEPA